MEIGTWICIKGEIGTILYYGKVTTPDGKTTEESRYGIEWDNAERGINDGYGLVEPLYHEKGVKCFTFIKENLIPQSINIEEALK